MSTSKLGFRVAGLGFRFKVRGSEGLGFRVQGLGFWASALMAEGLGLLQYLYSTEPENKPEALNPKVQPNHKKRRQVTGDGQPNARAGK